VKIISLFAGIGGFDLALTRHGHECVYANERDKYAASIYDRHFAKCDTRDIRTVPASEIPDHDLLVGGFPCQAFSIAGKRRGFADTRGTLFFEIARILRAKHPRLFILENVKGLLSHDNGNTFKTIIATLDELGYDLQWQVLNSKNFGVPQNRERVFIIGHLRGTSRPQVFLISEQSNPNTTESKSTKTAVARTLTGGGHSGGNHSGMTIIAKTVRVSRRGSPHGCKQNWDSYEFDGKIRRLTPTECERLQGFPDGWTGGVSDTQRYKCLGNAVTVNVVEYLVKSL
jgi:DNA (cytosine-5)-methyltransferase 1